MDKNDMMDENKVIDENNDNNKGGENFNDEGGIDATGGNDNELKARTFDLGDDEEIDETIKDEDMAHRNKDANEIIDLNEIPGDLGRWNMAAAFVLLGQAVAFYFLSVCDMFPSRLVCVKDNDNAQNMEWFVYTHFPATLDSEDHARFSKPVSDYLVAYNLAWYATVFLTLSGIYHLFCMLFRGPYHYYLERYQNPFRWTEYSLSVSVMRVMIAQLSGVTDLHLLFTIFILTATTMLLLACHESINAKARADHDRSLNWFPFAAAWIPHMASWVVIGSYFFYAVYQNDPPTLIWVIIFVMFALDTTHFLMFYCQWSNSGPAIFGDYIAHEKMLILFSITSKTALTWIYYGEGM